MGQCGLFIRIFGLNTFSVAVLNKGIRYIFFTNTGTDQYWFFFSIVYTTAECHDCNLWTFMNVHERSRLSWTFMNVHEHSWKFMNVHERSWTVVDCRGLSWTVVDCRGLSWTVVDCLGLPWTAVDCREGKILVNQVVLNKIDSISISMLIKWCLKHHLIN